MAKDSTVIAIYKTHTQADQAVKELQQSGFDMNKLSIMGKDYQSEEHPIGYYNTGDRVKFWGKLGAFWGGFFGLLFGSALFLIPGVGHVIVLGPLVGWLVSALEGAAVTGGLTALGAALYSIGIPKDSIVRYEQRLKAGEFILLGLGTPDEVARAREVLAARGGEVMVHKQ